MKEIEDETMLEKNKRWKIFNGSKETWQAFVRNFRSDMTMEGLGHTMIEAFKEILPRLENAWSQSDKQKQAVIENSKEMVFVKIYFQAPTFIATIEKEKTEEWPNGLVWKVIKMVKELYSPQEKISCAAQKKKLDMFVLQEDQDPLDYAAAIT